MARSTRDYDESDVRIRPSRRGSRPRSKDRPTHADAVPARVTQVDRGRYTTLVEEDGAHRVVIAMRARELGRKGIVVGDAVHVVGDSSGADGALAQTPALHKYVMAYASDFNLLTTSLLPHGKSVWHRDMLHYLRDRVKILVTLLQPVLMLAVLGAGLASLLPASPGGADYRTFLFPGMLVMAVQAPAISARASLVTDRQMGFLRELGVTDAQHKLVPAMSRKWKQINKFVEVLDHAFDGSALAHWLATQSR